MATKLEQAKAEMGKKIQSNTQNAQGKPASKDPTSKDPAANGNQSSKKTVWKPRWVAVMGLDGSFVKFSRLTVTATRDQIEYDENNKPAAVNVMAGNTPIATVDIPSDASVWSIKVASTQIKKELDYIPYKHNISSAKDGSADILDVRLGTDLCLRIYVGGINTTAIPAEIVSKYGLVVFHAMRYNGGWVEEAKITNNFSEAIEWIKARYTAPAKTTEEDENVLPF